MKITIVIKELASGPISRDIVECAACNCRLKNTRLPRRQPRSPSQSVPAGVPKSRAYTSSYINAAGSAQRGGSAGTAMLPRW